MPTTSSNNIKYDPLPILPPPSLPPQQPPHLIKLRPPRTNHVPDLRGITDGPIALEFLPRKRLQLLPCRRIFGDLVRGANDVAPETEDALAEEEV